MALWANGDQAVDWKMNKLANTGLDADKGLPTTMGEAFCYRYAVGLRQP